MVHWRGKSHTALSEQGDPSTCARCVLCKGRNSTPKVWYHAEEALELGDAVVVERQRAQRRDAGQQPTTSYHATPYHAIHDIQGYQFAVFNSIQLAWHNESNQRHLGGSDTHAALRDTGPMY